MRARGWSQRFLSTTRGQVVAALRRAPHTVEELASALGITDNAVRAHLSSLERDGLVLQSGLRRTQAKPAFVYDVTPSAERLFPEAYPAVLGLVLDELSERLGADALVELLREVGARLAARSGVPVRGDVRQRILAAVSALHELGSTLEIDTSSSQRDKIRLHGYSCPLASTTETHPEVCQAIESFLTTAIDLPVTECCERTGKPRCCFEVSAGPQRVA